MRTFLTFLVLAAAAWGQARRPDVTTCIDSSVGGTDSYTATASPPLTAWSPSAATQPQLLLFKPLVNNTGGATLNCGPGVVVIRKGAADPVNGELVAGQWYWLAYNGVDLQFLGGAGSAGGGITSGDGPPAGSCTAGTRYQDNTAHEEHVCTTAGWRRVLSTDDAATLLLSGAHSTTPTTPASGTQGLWFDSASGTPKGIDANAVKSTMVKEGSRDGTKFATHVPSSGALAQANIAPGDMPLATASQVGAVKPDGVTTTVDANGVISAQQNVGVSSVSGKSGAVSIVAGPNTTVDTSGSNIVISTTGGGAGTQTITVTLGGDAGVIVPGNTKVYYPMASSCTIISGSVTGTPSGSLAVEVWKAAGAIPTNVDKISASAPASLTTSQYNSAISLTGWDTAVTAGDILGFYVASATDVTAATVSLVCTSGTVPKHVIDFSIDGGGATIPTGDIGYYVPVNFACTIDNATIAADASGSTAVDIWKAAGAIPTVSDKISATAPVALSSAQLDLSHPLTGWSTAVSVGDVFGFSVASATTVTKITGQITCQ